MKEQTIKLNIENPCHENWDNMLEEEKGKFCQACQKSVVDFSRMTNEQIIDFINSTNEKICGRIAKHQLNVPISNYRNVKTPFFNRYVAGFVLALGLYYPATSQNTKPANEKVQTMGEISVRNKPALNKPLLIRGRLIHEKTKKPIAGALVTIAGSDKTTTSDKQGNYSIYVPVEFQNESLELVITKAGYETVYVNSIDRTKTEVNIVSKMTEEMEHLKGDIMIMGKIAPSNE